MNLSKRLYMNVSLVPKGAKVADIGCDHGYASIWLIQQNVAEKVIAMDVNKGPIQRAKEHIELAGLSEMIECRLSNGTEKLMPGETDTLMIAGMGGPLMVEILTAGRGVLEQIKTLVLQPQSDLAMVRHFLLEHDFEIVEEKACIDEGKYYFAIKAQRQDGNVKQYEKERQFRYGTYLIRTKNEVFLQYLIKERNTYRDILAGMQNKSGLEERMSELSQRISDIEACLLEMEYESEDMRKKCAQERK